MQAEKLGISTEIKLPEIGQPFEGGFFGGKIMVNGRLVAIIVSPKQFELSGEWGNYGNKIEGAQGTFDCVVNTHAMAEAGSEIAKQVLALEINGFTDWVIPSRDALEVLYRNFKPTDDENYCSFRDGDNPSSVPVGHLYSEESPAQTTVDSFKAGCEQAFDSKWYWSSTQFSALTACSQGFAGGLQDGYGKFTVLRVRPVRRLFIS